MPKAAKEKKPTQKEIREKLYELGDGIMKVAKVGEQLQKSNLKERAILLLLRDMTGLSMGDIKAVLEAIPMLDMKFLKEPQ